MTIEKRNHTFPYTITILLKRYTMNTCPELTMQMKIKIQKNSLGEF